MNFFGHATVAYRQSDDPRFVLGAMLPDLCSMAGLRLQTVLDQELGRGVALHHETDRRFHGSPRFLALCSSALETLEPQGVSRASARAVGHVGSELLLDGFLSHDQQARAAYGRALDGALEQKLGSAVIWKDGAHAASLHSVLARLQNAPIPEGYRDPEFVCARLEGILSRRPRLALRPGDREPVHAWLCRAADQLAVDGGAILAAVS